MPKAERHEDIHGANTVILDNGRGRPTPRPSAPSHAHPHPRAKSPPPPPAPTPRPRPVPLSDGGFGDDDVHSAPTMIIDIGRIRGRGRG